MKSQTLLTSLLILFGLMATTGGSYALARLLPDPAPAAVPGLPPLTQLNLPPQTQNGYTAALESYYADASRLIFRVRVTGGGESIGNVNLHDENGDFVNASTAWGPASGNDPALQQIEFDTVTPLRGERFSGQLVFSIVHSTSDISNIADFKFDLDIPIHPAKTYLLNGGNPQNSDAVSANPVYLDRLTITPAYTQVYVCYAKPTDADWTIGRDTTLTIDGETASLGTYALLYDAALADGSKGGEPGWKPVGNYPRCVKIGFPLGSDVATPASVVLKIPDLEQSMPEVIPQEALDVAYPKLLAQGIDMVWHTEDHGAYPEFKKLPAGMTQQEAMRKFTEALGYVYPGPWIFNIPLIPQESSQPVFSTSSYGAATAIPFPNNPPKWKAESALSL